MSGVTAPLHEPSREPAGRPPEQRVGRYRLLKTLGEGGMGVVHLGLDERGRAVAVKVLRDHVAYDQQARLRLSREVASLRRVDAAGVAGVLDADLDGPRPYLVTRYVPGPPLDEWLRGRPPLAGADLVRLARGLHDALTAIHAAGVVHRDVKPGNVLILDGAPVLIDFGIAHMADDTRLTATGLVMGTPGYLAPEVLAGQPVVPATDWWGWAATLAYAATGRAPFGGGPMDAVIARVSGGDCDLAGVDARLEPLLRAALAPEPFRRPPGPAIMAALEVYAAGGDTTALVPAAQPTVAVPPPGPAAGPAPEPEATQAYRVASTAHLPISPPGPPAAAAVQYARFGSAPAQPVPPASVPPVPPPMPATGQPPGPALAPPGPAPGPARPLPAAPADPRIGRRARRGTLAALAAALAAGAATFPIAALAVALVWSALARTADRSLTSLTLRRYEHGARGSDVPLALLKSPAHAVVAIGSALLTAIIPLAVSVAGVFSTALMESFATNLGPDPAGPVPLATGALLGMAVAWWGLGGTSLRRGSRSLVRGLAPGRSGAVLAGGMLLILASYLALRTQANGAAVSWWPTNGAPLGELVWGSWRG